MAKRSRRTLNLDEIFDGEGSGGEGGVEVDEVDVDLTDDLETKTPEPAAPRPGRDLESVKADIILARRFNSLCGNIRSKKEFDRTGRCVPGTIRSWQDGTETYIKIPGGTSRAISRDPTIDFAVTSGMKKSDDGDILRASDNTKIAYRTLNQTAPHQLTFNCPSAEQCDHDKAELLIGPMLHKTSPSVAYTTDEALLGTLRYKRDGTADFSVVSREEAKKKAQDAKLRIKEAMRKERQDQESKELESKFVESLNDTGVSCSNVRSVSGFKSRADCPPGVIRNFQKSNFLKVPGPEVRPVDGSVFFTPDSTLANIAHMKQAQINSTLRQSLTFDCADPKDCDPITARVRVGPRGNSVTYDRSGF